MLILHLWKPTSWVSTGRRKFSCGSSAQVAGLRVLDALQQADRDRVEQEVRYANITIIEGNQASQFGIGMVSARIAEIVLRDERGVIPIGSYNPKYGVTLSMPSVLGQAGVVQILEPAMSDESGKPCSGAPKR
jgi:L-lactate dehydrogenase